MAYDAYAGRLFAGGDPLRFAFRYEDYARRFGHDEPPGTWEEAKRRARQYRIAALADELAFVDHGLRYLVARLRVDPAAAELDDLGERLRHLRRLIDLAGREVNCVGDARTMDQLLALVSAAAATPGLWTPDPEEERWWRGEPLPRGYFYGEPLPPRAVVEMPAERFQELRRREAGPEAPPLRGGAR